MKEQLEQALVEIINKTLTTTDTATAFIISEMPDVVQQLLHWKLLDHIICGVFWVAFGAGISFFLKRLQKYMINKDEGEFDLVFITGCGIYFLGPLLIIKGLSDFLTVFQIWIAPKIFLIEYATQLTK